MAEQQKDNIWLLEESGYSEEEFYVKSKDDQGHSTYARVRFADHVFAQMGVLIQSKEIPEYRTIQDLIRDSVVHRLQYLSRTRNSRQASTLAQALLIIGELEKSSAFYEEIDNLFEAAATAVRNSVKADDLDSAVNLIEVTKTHFRARFTSEQVKRIMPRFDKRMKRLLKELEAD